jgi:CRISPR-associated protein Csd2
MISNRIEFSAFFSCTDGNPNGDPEFGNQPRTDPETQQGLMSGPCMRRKQRDWLSLTKSGLEGYEIYVKHGGILASAHKEAYKAIGKTPEKNGKNGTVEEARKVMCQRYADIRWFGGVLSTGKENDVIYDCGKVTGPVQYGFARSIDPVAPVEHTITRVALTNFTDTKQGKEAKAKAKETEAELDDTKALSGQMGSLWTIPFGLYRLNGYINPFLADDTGFNEQDLSLFFDSMIHMFDFSGSQSRANMAFHDLFVFTHDSKLGDYPAHKLFDLIQCKRVNEKAPARKYNDYQISVEKVPTNKVKIQHRTI